MNRRPHTYQEIAVQTSSPAKLVVMLYEGSIRFLNQSISAIQSKNLDRKRQTIDRAMAIIQHLQSTLDHEKGQPIAGDLDRLYTYITSRILDGSGKLDVAPLQEAIKLLTVLLSGWEEVAKKEKEDEVPLDLIAQQAMTGRFDLHA